MNRQRENELPLVQEAADWLARLEAGDKEAHPAFLDWVRQSPVHVREFLEVSRLSQRLSGIDPHRRRDVRQLIAQGSTTVIPWQDNAPTRTEARPMRRSRLPMALAATLALAVAAALLLQAIAPDKQNYTTGLGEQRIFKLSDGSLIHLNTQSRAQVSYEERGRLVRLTQGEALFVVAQDKTRPFKVIAGDTVIEAVGTEFNVYRRAAGTMVSVVEGRVRVLAPQTTPDDKPLLLSAGEGARIDGKGTVTQEAAVEQAIAWRQRQLQFRDTTLADAAAEFNRYNTMQIRLPDTEVRELKVTGFFNVDNPEGLLRFLSKDESLRIEKADNEATIRRAPALAR